MSDDASTSNSTKTTLNREKCHCCYITYLVPNPAVIAFLVSIPSYAIHSDLISSKIKIDSTEIFFLILVPSISFLNSDNIFLWEIKVY